MAASVKEEGLHPSHSLPCTHLIAGLLHLHFSTSIFAVTFVFFQTLFALRDEVAKAATKPTSKRRLVTCQTADVAAVSADMKRQVTYSKRVAEITTVLLLQSVLLPFFH